MSHSLKCFLLHFPAIEAPCYFIDMPFDLSKPLKSFDHRCAPLINDALVLLSMSIFDHKCIIYLFTSPKACSCNNAFWYPSYIGSWEVRFRNPYHFSLLGPPIRTECINITKLSATKTIFFTVQMRWLSMNPFL